MDPASRFEEQGCLVVDRLFDPALIDSVPEEFDRQYGSDWANLQELQRQLLRRLA